MTRIFGMNVFPEMLGLWLLETGACFLVFYALLHDSSILALHDDPLVGFSSLAAIDAMLLALTVALVGVAIGLYRPETCLETRRLLVKAVVAAAVSLPAVWIVAWAGRIDLAGLFGRSAAWPLAMLLAWSLLLLATRLLYTTALRMNLFVRRVVVLGPAPAAARIVDSIGSSRRGLFRVEAILPQPELDLARLDLTPLPAGLWGVVFAGSGATGSGITPALPTSVRRFDAESFSEAQLGRIDIAAAARHGDAAFADAAAPRSAAAHAAASAVRRLMDITLALLLLAMTAPLLAMTALLIRLESPGAVIYRQERVGLGGRPFTIWKFRSMRSDAERAGPTWASLRDARVTRVGRFIRKVRIDELPQLVNILRGDMSLVGPRPERPHFVEQLAGVIPLFHERARVKPGLTGWAQVNYPYGASVEDARAKLSYDLYYVKHRSLIFDLLILMATVRVILFQEGAR